MHNRSCLIAKSSQAYMPGLLPLSLPVHAVVLVLSRFLWCCVDQWGGAPYHQEEGGSVPSEAAAKGRP